jgi:hypothetical protein
VAKRDAGSGAKEEMWQPDCGEPLMSSRFGPSRCGIRYQIHPQCEKPPEAPCVFSCDLVSERW